MAHILEEWMYEIHWFLCSILVIRITLSKGNGPNMNISTYHGCRGVSPVMRWVDICFLRVTILSGVSPNRQQKLKYQLFACKNNEIAVIKR